MDLFDWTCPYTGDSGRQLLVDQTLHVPYAPPVLWNGRPSLWHFSAQIFLGVVLTPLYGLGLVFLFNAFERWFSVRYRITSTKVFVSKGLVVQSSRELRIADIRSVNILRQGLGGLLGLGTVEFSSAASDAASVFFIGIRSSEQIANIVRAIQDGHLPVLAASTPSGTSTSKRIGKVMIGAVAAVFLLAVGLMVYTIATTPPSIPRFKGTVPPIASSASTVVPSPATSPPPSDAISTAATITAPLATIAPDVASPAPTPHEQTPAPVNKGRHKKH